MEQQQATDKIVRTYTEGVRSPRSTFTEGDGSLRSIFNRMVDPQQIIPSQGQVQQQPAFLNFQVPIVQESIATQIDIDSQLKSIGKQRTRCDT